MLRNFKQNHQTGFTIIEVLIVLAIAGLIMVAVFTAVPSLRRASRNTQRKNDVAAVMASITEYTTNNNGSLPTTISATSGTLTLGAGVASTAKLSYYITDVAAGGAAASGNVTLGAKGGAVAAGVFVDSAHDYLVIYPGSVCDPANPNNVIAGSARSVAAIYEIETSGGYAQTCQST